MKRKLLILTGLVLMGAMLVPAVLSAAVENGTQKALDQAFFFALSRDHIDQFAALRDKGAGLNTTLKKAGLEPEATFSVSIAELLETDADVENWPILTWAVYLQKEDHIRVLISSGAALNSADRKGTVPLHWAAWTGNYPVVKTLLQNGANPFVQDNMGRSPLDWAILTGQADIIRLLPRVSMPDPPDEDQDGVPDYRDTCPLTPKGVIPDERGCWVIAHNGYFDFNKAVVKKRYIPQIRKAAGIMKKHPHLKLEIVGHTDNVGRPAYNEKLGLARAMAVMKILVKAGIDPNRLKVVTYGETRPIAPNDTAYGRAKNRRVEVSVFEPTPSESIVTDTYQEPFTPVMGNMSNYAPTVPGHMAYEIDDFQIHTPGMEPAPKFSPMPMMIPGPSLYSADPSLMAPVFPPPEATSYQPDMAEHTVMSQ